MSGLFGKIFPSNPITTPPPIPQPNPDVYPWLEWMRSHIGEPTVTGERATAFDKIIFSHTSDDEVEKTGIMASGCAAGACAALELTGYKSPHNAAALSFRSYGTLCELKRGCIVVCEFSPGDHHVTFCEKVNGDGTFEALGANQSHRVQVSTYKVGSILSCRWPIKA